MPRDARGAALEIGSMVASSVPSGVLGGIHRRRPFLT